MSRFFAVLALAALLCASAVNGQLCGGQGYDLSSLAGQQFSYFDGNYYYSVAPCGVVNNATSCPHPNYPDTAFCQASRTSNGTSLAQYSAANSTWFASQDGRTVTQTIQDGTSCGTNFPRETSLVFMCDATATTPVLVNATEVHTCYYTAFFRTAAACTVNNNAATGVNAGVGSTWFDTRCGAGVYDLSSLATQDLFWSPNPAALSTVWFLRVCGSVASPNCTATAGQGGSGIPANQSAMLCQSDQTNPTGNDNAASFYIANQQLWTITSTGISMSIQDGESCGTNFNRETTVNLVCNSSAIVPVMTNVAEVHTCYYTATVQTNLVCARAAPGSSSSAGGAVVVASSSSAAAAAPSSSAAPAARASSSSSAGSVVVVPASSSSSAAPVIVPAASSSSAAGVVAAVSSSSSSSSTAGGVIAPVSSSSSSTGAAVVTNTTVVASSSSSSTGAPAPVISGNGASAISASAMVMAAVLAAVALML